MTVIATPRLSQAGFYSGPLGQGSSPPTSSKVPGTTTNEAKRSRMGMHAARLVFNTIQEATQAVADLVIRGIAAHIEERELGAQHLWYVVVEHHPTAS